MGAGRIGRAVRAQPRSPRPRWPADRRRRRIDRAARPAATRHDRVRSAAPPPPLLIAHRQTFPRRRATRCYGLRDAPLFSLNTGAFLLCSDIGELVFS